MVQKTTNLIRQKWLIIGIVLILGLVKVSSGIRCCYSTASELKTPPNSYLLNLTASHVDSKKGNNQYAAAISFSEGYTVIGEPYSPFNEVDCSQTPGTGAITQFKCDSKDNPMFFVIFQLSVKFLPNPTSDSSNSSSSSSSSNSSITVSEVFIFGDKCQNVAYCTDLAAQSGNNQDDKISLGPLGTWPKYAVIIGGIVLGLSLLVACYLVYKRNRPDDKYRDRSKTPGTNDYEDKRMFSPNSLLRDGDDSPPSDEPPKNTLIQLGSVSAHTPERSKSVHNRNQHKQPSSLTKSSSTIKKKNENKDRNHQEIKIDDYDDDYGGKIQDKNHGSVLIKISDDGETEMSTRKTRKNHDKDNKNLKNLSDNSTSDLSKTISNNDPSDRELSGGGDVNNSTSIRRKKSKSGPKSGSKSGTKSGSKSRSKTINSGDFESRREKRSNNNDGNKLRKSSTLRETGEDGEGRRIDRTSSKGHRSRKDSSSPSSAQKSASDLQKGPSIRKRHSDRDLTTRNRKSNSHHQDDKGAGKSNRKSANLDRKKSRDIVSDGDMESTSDRLPLAILARSPTKSGQSRSWKSDGENDDDTTPLGRISSYSIDKTNSLGAASTSSQSRLITADKSSEDNNYISVLDDILAEDDDYPIGKRLSNISKEN